MGAAGSLWVEGTELHYLSATAAEWHGVGVLVGTPAGAALGSIWIEVDTVHYIDASGDERYLHITDVGANPVKKGSLWVEGNWLHWIDNQATQREAYWHVDTHTDVAHVDSNPHSDSYPHSDTEHSDTYPHSDSNPHSDTAHVDSNPHSDSAPHSDTPYSDVAHVDIPVTP